MLEKRGVRKYIGIFTTKEDMLLFDTAPAAGTRDLIRNIWKVAGISLS